MLCRERRTDVSDQVVVCPKCGEKNGPAVEADPIAEKRRTAVICAILLGEFGIHKFVLGYKRDGAIMLLATVLTFGYGAIVMWPIGVIEGIIYLRKSDEDFARIYLQGQRRWF
jgi:TM2 domain-containing membrane protein YozV